MPIVIDDDPQTQKKRQQAVAPATPPAPTEQQDQAQLHQDVAGNYIQEEQAQTQINSYLFSRAQAYIAGRAFRFAKDPPIWKNLPTNPTPLSSQENDWWIRHPDHWGSSVTLNVPEHHHDAIAKFFPSVYEFIGQQDTLADVPGALTALRLRAHNIKDPTARRFAVRYIAGIQRMSPGDQQLFLSILMDKLGFANPSDLFDHFLNDASASVSWDLTGPQRQRLNESLDRQLAAEKVQSGANENWWKLSNEQRAIQTQDPMSQNFGLPNVQMDNSLGFKDVLDIFLANAAIAGGVVAAGEAAPVAAHIGATIAGFTVAAKGASLATRGTASGLDAAGNSSLLADVPFFGGALRGAAGDITHVDDAVGATARFAQRELGTAANDLGTVAGWSVNKATFGKVKLSDTQKMVMGQILLALALEKVGTGADALKRSTTNFAGPAAGELGLTDAEGNVAGSLREAYANANPSLAHPWQSLTTPAVRYAIYNMAQAIHSTSVEDVVARWGGDGGFFDKIATLRDQVGADKVAAALREREGTAVPEDYAQFIASVPRDQMTAQTLIYFDDLGTREFKSTLGALGSVKATESRLVTQMASLRTQTLADEEAGVPAPERPAAIDQLVSDTHARLDALAARRIALEDNLQELQSHPNEPFTRLPESKSLPNFLHRVLYRPFGPTEQALRAVMNPLHYVKEGARWTAEDIFGRDLATTTLNPDAQPFLAKLVDKLERTPKLEFADPNLPVAERVIRQDKNLETLNRVMQRLGASPEDSLRIKQALMDAKTQNDYYDVVNNQIFGRTGVIAKYLPANVSESLRSRILSTSSRSSENLLYTTVATDAQGVSDTRPILGGGVTQGAQMSLPAAPSMFETKVPIPMGSIVEALGTLSRWRDRVGKVSLRSSAGGLLKADPNAIPELAKQLGADVYDFGKGAMALTTAIGKPLALLFNIPAIILTKMLDESMGNVLDPRVQRIFHTPEGAVDYFTRIDPRLTGRVVSGSWLATDPAEINSISLPMSALDVSRQGMTDKVAGGFSYKLTKMAGDEMLSKFTATGYDIPRMLRIMTDKTDPEFDPSLADYWETQQLPVLEKAATESGVTTTPEQLLEHWHSAIEDTTMHHPDLREFVASKGRIRETLSMDQAATLSDETRLRYQQATSDIDAIRERLRGLDPQTQPEQVFAAQRQLADKLNELNQIETDTQGVGASVEDLADERVRLHKQQVLATRIKKMYVANELQVPDKFTIPSEEFVRSARSLPDQMNQWAMQFGNALFSRGFPAIGKAEGKFAKGSFYSQRADALTKSYIAAGLDEKNAKALATYRAIEDTRDIFYDITTRSTAERSVRNIFWFAPVSGELLYRWLYAIPAQSGAWLPGAALNIARIRNYEQLLEATHIVQHDAATGQLVIPVTGLVNVLNKLTGERLKFPGVEEVPLKSLNPHLASPIPQLSIIPSVLLNTAAGHLPAIRGLAHAVSSSDSATFAPSTVINALGMLGVNTANLPFSTDYQKLQWARARDQGYQYAYMDMSKSGDLPPNIGSYGLDPGSPGYIKVPPPDAANFQAVSARIEQARNNYDAAWTTWFDRYSSLADKYSRGAAALRTISAGVLPGYIVSAAPAQQEFRKFWNDKILPQYTSGTPSPEVQATLTKWLGDHPDSLAFAVSYNYSTGKEWTTPIAETDPNYGKELLAQGIRAPMSPDDYAQFLVGKATRDTYRGRLNAQIQAAAPDGKPQTLLRNWYQRTNAVNAYEVAYNNWLDVNPRAALIVKQMDLKAADANHYPKQGLVSEWISQGLNAMRTLAPMFMGQGGVPDASYSSVMRNFKAAQRQLYVDTGGQTTPLDKGINWYFNNVLDPYTKETGKLHQQAAEAQASGADGTVVAAIYHKIDLIDQKYAKPKNGYPSPSEFFYSTMSPHEQQLAQINWLSKPVSWLTPFQRKTVGYPESPGLDKMFNEAYTFDNKEALPLIGNTPTGSKYYQQLKQWRLDNLNHLAQWYQGHGAKGAVDAMNMELAAPYVRLRQSGFAKGSLYMHYTYQAADYVHEQLTQYGLSPTSFSAYATALKVWFYTNLRRFSEQQDPQGQQFRRELDQLSLSQPTVKNTDLHPTGVQLYEGIFFDDHNPQYAPAAVTDVFSTLGKGPNG